MDILDLERKLEEALKEIEKKESLAVKKWGKELERLQEKYLSLIKEAKEKNQHYRANFKEHYYKKASLILLENLERDYSILQTRSISQFTPEELRKAQEIFDLVKDLNGEKGRQVKGFILQKEQVGINDAFIFLENQEELSITSYIGYTDSQCYLLSPVKDNSKERLVKDLEEKLLTIIGMKEIRDTEKIPYQEDYIFVNGFLFFVLTPEKGYAKKLSEVMQQKLIELQPEEFKAMRVTHHILETSILDYFKYHTLEDFSIETELPESEIKKHVRRNILERRARYGDDLIKYYDEHFPGMTRGEVQKADRYFYWLLYRSRLILNLPTKKGKKAENQK